MLTSDIESFDELPRRLRGGRLPPTAQAAKKALLLTHLRDDGYRCIEGVAVAYASDGWWLLFPHGTLGYAACAESDRSSRAFGDRSC